MKVVSVELAIWFWWTALVLSVGWVCPLMADQENDSTTLRFNTITFNTEGGTKATYNNFIQNLGNQLKGSEVEKIPVLRNPGTVKDPQRFLLVKLQASQNTFVTLVVDVTTLYVLGYADRYQGKDRAHFFPDKEDKAIPIARRLVFQGATRLDIPYGFSYDDLESAAGSARRGIPLGIESLQNYIGRVFGLAPAQTPNEKKQRNMVEAKFLLIAVQMVSEAARFKYLENKINQEDEFPDNCVTALELVWAKISKAVQKVGTLNIGNKLDVCPGLRGLKGDQLTKAIIQQSYMGILKNKVDGLYAIPIVSRIMNGSLYYPYIGIPVIIAVAIYLYISRSEGHKQHAS